ncbi:MAG: hypothetical protein GC186_17995 [Rhodobacteraceae bacterium]|nr:hypothetical protein [Paracoccaceae bacterium]
MSEQHSVLRDLDKRELAKAGVVGVIIALLLSAIMVPVFKAGVAPMPMQPSLAFAETVLGRPLPLVVGLFFHLAYVTLWSMTFVVLFRTRLTFRNALLLALGLWIVALVVFFPIVGWGFLGLAVGPKLIVAALVPHLLFAVFLWIGCRIAFSASARAESVR